MSLNRRQFLSHSALLAASLPVIAASARLDANESSPIQLGPRFVRADDHLIRLNPASGDELQRMLNQHRGSKKTIQLNRGCTIKCTVREGRIGDETSIHPLLIPEGVILDLNESTLLLELKSNSYGVRLSTDSAIRNGTIRVIASENKGSQACWHSGVCVGAAYGDGGTTAKLGYFSAVKNWAIEDVTIDQPFAASAIQLMSEACYGIIRNIRILDSARALLGVGMDWGSVGPMTSEDQEISRMRQLWEQGQIYSTHPHHILVEKVRVGKLTRNIDANDAGVRCSACHDITIRDVEIEAAATAIAIFGGDLGYEFARQDQRDAAHQRYLIEDITIQQAFRCGLVLNGASDNVWRATRNHNYQAVRDPVAPGLNRPVLRRLKLTGPGPTSQAQGIYAVSVTDATLESFFLSDFNIAVHPEDWVNGMSFRDTKFRNNLEDKRIEGVTSPARGVQFHD